MFVPVWYMYLDLSVLGTMEYIQNGTPAIPPPPANRTFPGLSSCVCEVWRVCVCVCVCVRSEPVNLGYMYVSCHSISSNNEPNTNGKLCIVT